MKAQTISHKLLFTMSFLLFMIILSRPAQALYDVNITGDSDVYGLSGDDVRPAIGSEFGTVRAIADTNNAYALFGDGGNVEIIGDFPSGGIIYAKAGTDNAYGLYIDVNSTISTGNIDGNITAIAGNNYAYGLYCDDYSSISIGNINGIISATAGNSYAYGLYSNDKEGSIVICGGGEGSNKYTSLITGDINGAISASSGNDYAYGLFSENSMTIGEINGSISANAISGACGLVSASNSITTGAINGTINTLSSNNGAVGLSAQGSITTGDINGIITANAGNDYASGMSCFAGSITTGDIEGTITAEAVGSSAYGLNSINGSIITGDINGDITVSAGTRDASGLDCGDAITTGNINGTINVTAGTDRAYGLTCSNDPITIGDIDGTISATAGDNYACGLYMWSGDASVTTGAIKGTISAHAGGDYAYGILSYGPINTIVDGGTIIAIADAGDRVAAIQSGTFFNSPFRTQNADDRVEIVAGSTIIGDIDLAMYGTDNDILTLSGVNSNSTTFNDDLKNIETINLSGGTWYINGDVYNSLNGINMTGGVLGGTGTLESLNVIDGTLAPGNSIGTTTINGDLTLGADSTLEVEIDNSGNSDKLVVSGDASINGGTLKPISTETITESQEYTIIEAQNVFGKFDTVDTALLSTTLSNPFAVTDNLSNAVLLKIFPMQFNSSEIVTTEEQASLGSALQVIAEGGGNSITARLQQLPNLSELRNAYDQLSGQTIASLASVTSTGSTQFTGTVSGRLHNTHSGLSSEFNDSPLFAMAQPDRDASMYDTGSGINSFALGNGTNYFANEKWGLWLRGYGVFGDRETQSESPGYQYRIYGTGFGVDYKFTDELLLGVTGGYSDGQVDYFSSRDESEITGTPIGIYGSWFTESGYVDSLISYTPMEYETTRYVDLTSEKLKGQFDGSETSAYLEAGRNWFLSKDWLVQPMTSFQYSYLSLDDYTESGGVSALSFDEHCYHSYKGSLGMKAKKQFLNETKDKNLTFELRGRWIHEFGDTKSNVNANFASNPSAIFKISDKGLPRDSAILGIGLKQIEKQNMMYYIDYDISLNREDTSHIISAGLRYLW